MPSRPAYTAHDPVHPDDPFPPPAKTRRTLGGPKFSIDKETSFLMREQQLQKELKAAEMHNMSGLRDLAHDHLNNFEQLFGSEIQRRMAPNRVIRVATACTGSGAEVFTLLAIINTFRHTYPALKFSYVFHCEKVPQKRQFVKSLHRELAEALGAEIEPEPCFFDDLTKLSLSLIHI